MGVLPAAASSPGQFMKTIIGEIKMFEATRAYLKSIGMPEGDAFDMP